MTRSLRITKNPRNNLEAVSNITQDNKNKSVKLNLINNKNEKTFNISSVLNISKDKNMKYSKNTSIELISCFVAEPSRIDFLEYGIGDKMVQTLVLRNISAVSRTLRVLPPRSDRFFLSPLLYPSGKYVSSVCIKICLPCLGSVVLSYCIVLYCTILNYTILYRIIPYYNALFSLIVSELTHRNAYLTPH